MGPSPYRTRDPWICSQTRICGQTRYRLRFAPGIHVYCCLGTGLCDLHFHNSATETEDCLSRYLPVQKRKCGTMLNQVELEFCYTSLHGLNYRNSKNDHLNVRSSATVLVRNTLNYHYDVASGSEIAPCNKIDKPLMVYRFKGNIMRSIITLRT